MLRSTDASADSDSDEDKLVNPEIGDKQDTVDVIRKQFGQFVPRSRVNNHPALDAERPQQAKVMDRKNASPPKFFEACSATIQIRIWTHAGRKMW